MFRDFNCRLRRLKVRPQHFDLQEKLCRSDYSAATVKWSFGDDWNRSFSYRNRHRRWVRLLERPPHAVARHGPRALGAAIPPKPGLTAIHA